MGQDFHIGWQRARPRVIALLVVAVLMPWPLLLTHGNWWAFVLAAAAIMVALRLLFGRAWTDYAGLELPPRHALWAVLAFAAVAAASEMLLPFVYEAAAIKANPPNLEEQVGFLFQALNEEMLYRALLIGIFVQALRSAPVNRLMISLIISLGLGLLFPLAHFLLYRFSNPMHWTLSIASLATLYFAGVAMNNLYLAFRHIGFSWALHAGWNVAWLPATFYDAASNHRLAEPQVFDLVLGTPAIVAMAGATAALSFLLLARRPQKLECP